MQSTVCMRVHAFPISRPFMRSIAPQFPMCRRSAFQITQVGLSLVIGSYHKSYGWSKYNRPVLSLFSEVGSNFNYRPRTGACGAGQVATRTAMEIQLDGIYLRNSKTSKRLRVPNPYSVPLLEHCRLQTNPPGF